MKARLPQGYGKQSMAQLMQQAQQAGCQTIGGMEMLVWQAAAAQEIWFGRSFSDRQVAQVAAKM